MLLRLGVLKDNITLIDSGESAVAQFTALHQPGAVSGGPVHTVVLLDIHLGIMSGMDVMRALPPLPSATVFVACTSFVNAEEQEKYRAAGFAGLLGKPFGVSDLSLCLQTVCSYADVVAQAPNAEFFVAVKE